MSDLVFQVGTVLTHMPHMPQRGLHPAVGMHSEGEEVRINLDAKWEHPFVTLMSIDSCEEDWIRLHDVRVNGQVSRSHTHFLLNYYFLIL